MEFRDTLLAAQRNQQQQSSSSNSYYKAKFDPPKKEQKQKDRLSANILKFLAKKEEEEKQKKLEAQRKHQELLAMRDPKALRKIQKTLKVIKSANKSVLADAVDRDNTAVTREGPDQPDQDDYGYESQEAAALYEKMMQKYSKIPDEPKFPTGGNSVKKDLNGTRERVKHALQHEDDPVPHKRRRKGGTGERDSSPPQKYEPEKEKRKDEQTKSDKPKIRKPLPPPIDFNQLLKLAEQKKSEPVDVAQKKNVPEQETERPMTKKQRREYEEEMARRQRRQERLDAEKGGGKKVTKQEKPVVEREKKPEATGFSRIPKLGDKNVNNSRNESSKISDRERLQREKDKIRMDKEKVERDREMIEREREKIEREKQLLELERLKAEREKLDRHIEMLNKKGSDQKSEKSKTVDKMLDRSKFKENGRFDSKKSIDLKSQNTYRIDKNAVEKKSSMPAKSSNGKYINGDSSKTMPKTSKEQLPQRDGVKEREMLAKQKSLQVNGSLKANGGLNKKPMESNKLGVSRKPDEKSSQRTQAGPSKPKAPAEFDFDSHINSLKKNSRNDGARKFPPGDVRRKQNADDPRRKPKRRLDSDSEYDSEMDDFIDDGDENMDYSSHIKEIFGYDKSKYRDMDDDDDPDMESSFARQQREEYISKKIGIMEDLEDMRMEAMEKKKSKKKRRISDD